MILTDILKKIFGKKKKAVKPTPPVVYTPPTPQTTPIKIENDDVNDYSLQSSLFSLRMKELGVKNETYAEGIKNLDNKFKLILSPTEAQIIENKTLKDAYLKRYQSEGLLLVQDLQFRAKNLVNIFNKETDLQKKKVYSNFYLPLRAELNRVYDNFLVGEGYLMQYATVKDVSKPVSENPNVGGATQMGTRINTNETPTLTEAQAAAAYLALNPPNVQVTPTVFPNWVNKDYLTSEYVIYNGLTYKNKERIYGNNNNTPDKDNRWDRV